MKIKDIILGSLLLFLLGCSIANQARADIDGHRMGIFFNLTDFTSGLITKHYLMTRGHLEYELDNRFTLGARTSFIKDKISDVNTSAIGLYLDYIIYGNKKSQFFTRGLISYSNSISDSDVRKKVTYDLYLGKKYYFDNRFAIQFGAGLSADNNKISHFNQKIFKLPFSVVGFMKLGYWF